MLFGIIEDYQTRKDLDIFVSDEIKIINISTNEIIITNSDELFSEKIYSVIGKSEINIKNMNKAYQLEFYIDQKLLRTANIYLTDYETALSIGNVINHDPNLSDDSLTMKKFDNKYAIFYMNNKFCGFSQKFYDNLKNIIEE
jgi:hypothetical protein